MNAALIVMLVLTANGPNSLSRSPRETWTAAGWMDFRFGMGPADVVDILASPDSRVRAAAGAIRVRPSDSDLRLDVTETSLAIAARRVRVMFVFFRERLYDVVLYPVDVPFPYEFGKTQESEPWTRGLEQMVRDNYGTPTRSPTGGLTWEKGDVTVKLDHAFVSFKHSPTSEQARRESEAAEQRMATTVTDEDSMPQTSPESWSKYGWRDLRWGMGLGDVVKRIARTQPDTDRFDSGDAPDETFLLTSLRDEVYGSPVAATFFFNGGALSRLEFNLESRNPLSAPSCQESRAWHRRAHAALTKGNKEPRCTTEREGRVTECEWLRPPDIHVRLMMFIHGEGRCGASLEFGDATREAPLATAAVTSTTTASASWKSGGWTEFKWGMGIKDVDRVLRDKRGTFKASATLRCVASGDTRGGTECDLESGSHEFTVVGTRPSLAFDFLDGKFYRAQLNFFVAGRDVGREKFSRVQSLMREKYGVPGMALPQRSEETTEFLGASYWDGSEANIQLTGGVASGRATVSISYVDPSIQKELRSRRKDANGDREKL